MTTDRVDAYLERSSIDTTDVDLIQKHLEQAYSARLSIAPADEAGNGCSYAHSRIDTGGFAIEEITHHGNAVLRTDRMPAVVAVFVQSGRVEVEHGRLNATAGPGQWLLVSTGVGGVQLRSSHAVLRSVVVSRTLLTEVAAMDTDTSTAPRFTALTPATAAAGHILAETERFLHRVLNAAPEQPEHRLLLTAAGRLLASAILTAFPNDLPAAGKAERPGDAYPALLRQAVEFIQDNAAHDVGVGDVASALYLSPRTVQYMFRRHLDTTPTAYLREVRLTRAREELIASDRSITTVAATAARWGFAHTGRFAVLYRRTFGESPHETLRR